MTKGNKALKLNSEREKSNDEIRAVSSEIGRAKTESDEKTDWTMYAPLSGIIKDELFFISSLILFVGIISTEAYYHGFGVRYQLLSLPVFHIVYRGFTAIFASPVLLFPYFVAVAWLVLDGFAIRKGWWRFLRFQRPLSYLLILIVLSLTYPIAQQSGRIQAESDLKVETSSLPVIQTLDNKLFSEQEVTDNQYRLLMIDSDHIIFFKPLTRDQPETVPIIHRLPKGEVHVLSTN